MSVSDNDQGDGFSYANKRLYKSFLKLFCNHLFEYDDGNLGINLRLETFGAYDVNREAIKQTLNDIIRAFGASVYFPRHRSGDVVEQSKEGIYLENTNTIPENVLDALDLVDPPRQALLIDQCLQESLRASIGRSSEGRFLQKYLDQKNYEVGPDASQSLSTFVAITRLYLDVIKVLGLLVDIHSIKAHWSEILKLARNNVMRNPPADLTMNVRDLVDCYTEYEVRFRKFMDVERSLRGSIYTTDMIIISDLEEWHDRISQAAFSEGPGCEPILEPSLDPPGYGHMMTVLLGQV